MSVSVTLGSASPGLRVDSRKRPKMKTLLPTHKIELTTASANNFSPQGVDNEFICWGELPMAIQRVGKHANNHAERDRDIMPQS